MDCPKCKMKMEEGFLQGMRRLAWVKKPHKISLLPKEGEVLLENNPIKDFIFPARICKNCKQVIIDYSDNHID